jgi:oligosaccharide repeat unit polymerase
MPNAPAPSWSTLGPSRTGGVRPQDHGDQEARTGLTWLVALSGGGLAIALVATDAHVGVDLSAAWAVLYAGAAFVALRELAKGLFHSPFLLLPTAYFMLIVVGTNLFELLRGRATNVDLPNLVGIGFLALLSGLGVGSVSFTADGSARGLGSVSVPRRSNFLGLLLFAALGCVAAALLFLKLGAIPMLSPETNEAKAALLSGSGAINLFFVGGTIAACFAVYAAALSGDPVRMRLSHAVAIALVIMLTLSGTRSKTVLFVLQYLATWMIASNLRVSFRQVAWAVLLLAVFMAGVGAARRDDDSSAFDEARIILIARPAMFERIYTHFDLENAFHGSRYFSDLKKLLPGADSGANTDLKYELFPNADQMPELSGVSPSIVGEAYMNFGAIGIPAVMFFVGMLGAWTYMRMRQSLSAFALIGYLLIVFMLSGAMSSGLGARLVPLVIQLFWLCALALLYRTSVAPPPAARPATGLTG